MTEPLDIRWRQRLEQYGRALAVLREAVDAQQQHPLTRLEKQGVIQAFEFTHELAWNLMKDYLAWQGNVEIMGARDAMREAFAVGLIEDGEHWMRMIPSRNQATHTYNEATADAILADAVSVYYPLFVAFESRMKKIADER